MTKKNKIVTFILSMVTLMLITNIATSIESPTGLVINKPMPGMTVDQVTKITGIHSGMEKAIVKMKDVTSETWYLYFDSLNEKWLVEKCEKCEYWEIKFISGSVKSVRVLMKSQ